MNSDRIYFVAISVVVGALLVALMTSGSDKTGNPDCLAPKGCTLYIAPADQLRLGDGQGNKIDVTRVTIRLTKDQAKVLKNPNGVLIQARSYLVKFADSTKDCPANQSRVNEFVTTSLVAQDTWQKVTTGSDPVTICE